MAFIISGAFCLLAALMVLGIGQRRRGETVRAAAPPAARRVTLP